MNEVMEEIQIKSSNMFRDVLDYELNGTTWKLPYIKYGLEKVIDWKRDEVWAQNPSSGTALVSALRQHKFNEAQLKPVNDKKTGVRIGWGTGNIDQSTGMPMLGFYKIDQLTMELNLANIDQRKLYFFIATNPMVLDSPNCWVKKNAMLEIVDRNADAIKDTQTRVLRFKAYEESRKIEDPKQVRDIVSIFEDISADMPDVQIRSKMEQYAETHPKEFIDLLKSNDRAYMIVFAKGSKAGIITQSLEHGFEFGHVRLGLNKEEVIEYLKKNPEMQRHISNEISKHDSAIAESRAKKPVRQSFEQDSQMESENAELRKQLLEQSSLMAEMKQMILDLKKGKKDDEQKKLDDQDTTIIQSGDKPLDEMTIPELKEICIENAYPQAEWSKLQKQDLLDYVISQKSKDPEREDNTPKMI